MVGACAQQAHAQQRSGFKIEGLRAFVQQGFMQHGLGLVSGQVVLRQFQHKAVGDALARLAILASKIPGA